MRIPAGFRLDGKRALLSSEIEHVNRELMLRRHFHVLGTIDCENAVRSIVHNVDAEFSSVICSHLSLAPLLFSADPAPALP